MDTTCTDNGTPIIDMDKLTNAICGIEIKNRVFIIDGQSAEMVLKETEQKCGVLFGIQHMNYGFKIGTCTFVVNKYTSVPMLIEITDTDLRNQLLSGTVRFKELQ